MRVEHKNLGWDPDDAPPRRKLLTDRGRLQSVLCVLQVLAAIVAAALVFWDVESILATCPALAAIGVVLALVSAPSGSWAVMGFALSAPLVTSLIALLISAFRWNQPDAEQPCAVILVLYAAATLPGAAIARSWSSRKPSGGVAATVPLRFSLKSALITTTVACVFLGIAQSLPWTGSDALVFNMYGLGVLVVCAAIAAWFSRTRRLARRLTQQTTPQSPSPSA